MASNVFFLLFGSLRSTVCCRVCDFVFEMREDEERDEIKKIFVLFVEKKNKRKKKRVSWNESSGK